MAWALAPAADLRQQALVYDWCQDLLTEAQRTGSRGAPGKRHRGHRADASIPAVRSRALAAVALYDHVPQAPRQELERVVHQWWNGRSFRR